MLKSPRLSSIFSWTFEEDPCGSLELSSAFFPFIIYCTPFWEDTNGIAIQIQTREGEELHLETIPFLHGEKEVWQKQKYDDIISTNQWQCFLDIMQMNLLRLMHAATRSYWNINPPKPKQKRTRRISSWQEPAGNETRYHWEVWEKIKQGWSFELPEAATDAEQAYVGSSPAQI